MRHSISILAKTTALMGFAVSVVFTANPAQAALLWNFSYTASNSGLVESILTTDSNSYTTNFTYTIQGISGTVNGKLITKLLDSINELPMDNKFNWDGMTGIILSYDGIGFEDNLGIKNNIYSDESELINFNVPSNDFSNDNKDVTSVSLTPLAVPEPITILGTVTAVGFGAKFKQRLAQSQESKKDVA
jgi:hypothetical protein